MYGIALSSGSKKDHFNLATGGAESGDFLIGVLVTNSFDLTFG